MSRITCLIIFSGSSALSIRSLRLARTNVETRSSNAMMNSFFELLALSLLPNVSCVMFAMLGGALRTLDSLTPDGPSDGDANRYSNGQPDGHVSGSDSEGRSQSCAQRDSQSHAFRLFIHKSLLRLNSPR